MQRRPRVTGGPGRAAHPGTHHGPFGQPLADRSRIGAHSIALLIAGFTLLRLLLAATVPLLPQEAYYWSWSLHLDWSYFDHPPLASLRHRADHRRLRLRRSFGIKSAAVLWSLGWNLLWARLILDMFADRRLAFWSLLALNLTLAVRGLRRRADARCAADLRLGRHDLGGLARSARAATAAGGSRPAPSSAWPGWASTRPCCCCRWCCCTC